MLSFALALAINTAINKLPYRTDEDRYGLPEFWEPIDSSGGDCEDFALAKRDTLLAAGVDRKLLHLAVAFDEHGSFHAVLIVDTDEGSYVLDNRFPYPMPKQALNYKWQGIQNGSKWYDLQ